MKLTQISFMKFSEDFDLKDCGMDLAQLFVESGLCKSKTEFRNGVKNGGIRVQDMKITDPFARITIFEEFLVVLERKQI
jgi:tyrosyl-tRNA synthetase